MNKVRFRSKKYMRFIGSKPCLICGNHSDAHHLTFAEHRAKSIKNGDNWCVPLCRIHHMQLHEFAGGEETFWAINGIQPKIWATATFRKWLKDNGDADGNWTEPSNSNTE